MRLNSILLKKIWGIFLLLTLGGGFLGGNLAWAACVPLPTCTCPPVPCVPDPNCPTCQGKCPPPPPPPGPTPFLFTFINNDYIIENVVLKTYHHQYHEIAKQWYEKNSGDKKIFKQTDYYRLRLNPNITKEGVKLLIKEIKPTESYFDQVKLLRFVHPLDTSIFVDHETNTIKAVKEKNLNNLISCTYNALLDCQQKINAIDDHFIEGDVNDEMVLTFNVSGLKDENLYLTINSWESFPLGVQSVPFQTQRTGESLKLTVVDKSNPENTILLKDIHPREIEDTTMVYLGNALKNVSGDSLILKLRWTAHHSIGYIGLVNTKNVDYQKEDLLLKQTIHSEAGNVLQSLLHKDHLYAHTVKGHQIELIFEKPKIELTASQKETYVFASSGFYHGLRTYMYQNIDTSDSFEKEIKGYLRHLNNVLKKKLKSAY